jgi:hypothetical protein
VAIFHKFVASLGPKFAVADIDASSEHPPSPSSDLRGMADIIRAIEARTARTSHPFRYCAGKIASTTPTGYCSYVDGQYCLGITTAFYYCCYEAAFRLFQSNQTFRDIDPPAEAPPPDLDEDGIHRPWGFFWVQLLRAHVDRFARPEDATPFDASATPDYEASFAVPSPLRTACATYVMFMMMRFLWHHEFAHAISGHLPYLIERKRIRTLSENDWLDLPADKQLDTAVRVWMEHDADTSALKTLLNETLEGGTVTRTGVEAVDDDIALRIRLDVMAFVLALLVIFFQHDWTSGPGTHPDPYSRIFVTVSTAVQFLQRAHPDSGPITNAVMEDIKGLIRANRNYLPLAMFFTQLTVQLAFDEYNDLVARVDPELPRVRAHSFFDKDGLLRA